MERGNVDLSTCVKGDILVSALGGILRYNRPTFENEYLDHSVEYLDPLMGSGTRTNDGYVYANNRIPNSDHDIIKIIKLKDINDFSNFNNILNSKPEYDKIVEVEFKNTDKKKLSRICDSEFDCWVGNDVNQLYFDDEIIGWRELTNSIKKATDEIMVKFILKLNINEWGTMKKGETKEFLINVFDENNGLVRHPIDKRWDIVSKEIV